jgi:hypothetical protein
METTELFGSAAVVFLIGAGLGYYLVKLFFGM